MIITSSGPGDNGNPAVETQGRHGLLPGFPTCGSVWVPPTVHPVSGAAEVGEKRESWRRFNGVGTILWEGRWVKILGRNRASIADKITGDTKYFLLLDTSKVYPKSCIT